MDIIIPRNKLLVDISAEEIIKIINTLHSSLHSSLQGKEEKEKEEKEYFPASAGKKAEKIVVEFIEGFESRKPGPHSGDLLIWKKEFPEIILMLEVKNYSNPVPQEQYKKFIYDLEINKFAGGIFISNKPIAAFSEPLLQSNKIILIAETFENQKLIQLACDALWLKLFEQMRFGFLTQDISEQCSALVNGLETLVRVKTNVENMKKSVKRATKLIVQDIDKHIYDSREIVKQIMLNFRSVIKGAFKVAPIILPELTAEDFKLSIEKFINSNEFLAGLDTTNIYVKEVKNCVEITYTSSRNLIGEEIITKKLKLQLLKTKVNFSFKPTNFNFENIELSYSDGLICFSITKKNISSSIWDNIMKFW